MWKMRNALCRSWNMAGKLKKVEKETKTLYDLNMVRKLEKVEKETQTLYDLQYGEKPGK